MKTRTRHNTLSYEEYLNVDPGKNATVIDFFIISLLFFFLIVGFSIGLNGDLVKALFMIFIIPYFIFRKFIIRKTKRFFLSFIHYKNPYFMTLIMSPFFLLLSRGFGISFFIYTGIFFFFINHVIKDKQRYFFQKVENIAPVDRQQLLNNYNYSNTDNNVITAAKKYMREKNYKMKFLLSGFTLSAGICLFIIGIISLGLAIAETYNLKFLEYVIIGFTLFAIGGYFIRLIALGLRYKSLLDRDNDTFLFHSFHTNNYIYTKKRNNKWGFDYIFHKKK